MKLSKSWLFGGAAALALAGGVAVAQVSLPLLAAMGQTDLVQVIPAGQPHAGNQYVPAGELGGMSLYSLQVPLTGFTITAAAGINQLILNPAGTLATGTLTLPPSPSDGSNFCVWDSQTQTAITVNANTGQSLNTTIGAATPTALTAKTSYCWRYLASQAAWYRYL